MRTQPIKSVRRIKYDAHSDILYVSFVPERRSYGDEYGHITLMRDMVTDEITGLIIYSLRQRREEVINDLQNVKQKTGFIFNLDDLNSLRETEDEMINQQEWISVNDRLPEQHMTYLFNPETVSETPSGVIKSRIVLIAICCEENGEPKFFITRGFLKNNKWYELVRGLDEELPFRVTHWMPMPKPPTKQS